MILDLSDGKSIPQAHREYFTAMLIATQKWRRDLIKHWTTSGLGSGFRIIDGKKYWGGTFNFKGLLGNPDKVRMADLFGFDDQAKHDVTYIDGADRVYARFNPKPNIVNPYLEDNFAFMVENGLAPHLVSTGLSSITFKGVDVVVPCKWFTRTIITDNGVTVSDDTVISSSYLAESTTATTNGTITTTIIKGLDDPYHHAPDVMVMDGVDKASLTYHPNFSFDNTCYLYPNDGLKIKNDFGNSYANRLFIALYQITGMTDLPNTKSSELVHTNVSIFTNRQESWVFQTWHRFEMGDYEWMSEAWARTVYPQIAIGNSAPSNYFTFFNTLNFRGGGGTSTPVPKNMAAYIMDFVDYNVVRSQIASAILSYVTAGSQYTWAKVIDGNLWFEYDYIMSMDIKDFTHLIGLHIDIKAEADDDGGFFGTFIGSFVGAVVGLFSKVLDVFFKIVELLDFVTKPTINLILKYVFKLNDADRHRIMNAYTEIRNQVALIVVTLGIGASLEGASVAAEATFASIGGMELAGYGLQIGMAGFNGFNAIDPSAGAATASAVEDSVRSTNPMQLVYGDSDIDLIDAWYVMMGDPMMMVERENDVLDIVYG